MTERELREIRRHLHPDKTNITAIHGCLINDRREIVARFHQSTALSESEETEKLLFLLKKTLSGSLGTNLLDLAFSTKQVEDSDEHRLLMALKRSGLKDERAVEEFFTRAAACVEGEGNHVLLLASDTYDVFSRSRDGQRQEASETVYSFLLCCVCPIVDRKPALTYDAFDNAFHTLTGGAVLGAPDMGFLFPAFDNRTENIYNALYYTRDITGAGTSFAQQLLHTQLPMPAAVQKETFDGCMREAVAEDCALEVVRSVHQQLCEMVEEYKHEKHEEPLTLSKGTVSEVLQSCGVDETHTKAFAEKFDEDFGEHAQLPPRNIMDLKQFQVKTPDVSIKVNPQRTDLISTQIIGGTKYILIRADEDVEVNGIPIHIK